MNSEKYHKTALGKMQFWSLRTVLSIQNGLSRASDRGSVKPEMKDKEEGLYSLRKGVILSKKTAQAELLGCNKSPIPLQKYHPSEKL